MESMALKVISRQGRFFKQHINMPQIKLPKRSTWKHLWILNIYKSFYSRKAAGAVSHQQMCWWQKEYKSFSPLSREDIAEALLKPVVFIIGELYASSRGTGLAGSLCRRQREGTLCIYISLGFHTSLENGLTVFTHSCCSPLLCQEDAPSVT